VSRLPLIVQALTEIGPMTSTELARHLGVDRDCVASYLKRLRYGSPQVKRCVRIESWAMDQEGQRRYTRAVYAIGTAPDAKKPKVNPTQRGWECRRNLIKRYRGASVFRLGWSDKQVLAEVRS
jgi:hypothetical protein